MLCITDISAYVAYFSAAPQAPAPQATAAQGVTPQAPPLAAPGAPQQYGYGGSGNILDLALFAFSHPVPLLLTVIKFMLIESFIHNILSS